MINEFKTIKELEAKEQVTLEEFAYGMALKDVLGLLKTDKTKEEIIKEIEG